MTTSEARLGDDIVERNSCRFYLTTRYYGPGHKGGGICVRLFRPACSQKILSPLCSGAPAGRASAADQVYRAELQDPTYTASVLLYLSQRTFS